MKFCSKCGKHYKDSSKFCGSCGIELTQMTAENSSGIDTIKENVSNVADVIGDKAKDILSDENKKKMQEGMNEAISTIKNMDVNKGKEMVNSGVNRFNALSGNTKKAVVGVCVLIVALLGYYFFSPEKQVERAFNNTVETMMNLGGVSLSEWSDSDVDRWASIYPPKVRDKFKQELLKQRDIAIKNPGRNKTNFGNMKSLTYVKALEGAKIKSIKINGDTAILEIVGGNGDLGMGKQQMKKIDGEWYFDGIAGTN